jgi:hypothetical protein
LVIYDGEEDNWQIWHPFGYCDKGLFPEINPLFADIVGVAGAADDLFDFAARIEEDDTSRWVLIYEYQPHDFAWVVLFEFVLPLSNRKE